MLYFAYGTDLNAQSLREWSDHLGIVPPFRGGAKGAVLRNYRMCFPVYEELWGGGIADAVPEPGKYVAGALFNIHRISLKQLDHLFMAEAAKHPKRLSSWARVTVAVVPYSGGEAIQAWTYRLRRPELRHVPPTLQYKDRLIDAAGNLGLSSMWVMHLQSFGTCHNRPMPTSRPLPLQSPPEMPYIPTGFGVSETSMDALAVAG